MLRWGGRPYPRNFAKFLWTNYTEQNTLLGKGKTLRSNKIFIQFSLNVLRLTTLSYWISFQLLILFTFWKERKSNLSLLTNPTKVLWYRYHFRTIIFLRFYAKRNANDCPSYLNYKTFCSSKFNIICIKKTFPICVKNS